MNQPINLTLTILTKNSNSDLQKNYTWLKKCPNINEIIIVDDLGTENPKPVFQKLASSNTKITKYSRPLNSFSFQRKFGITKSSNDWILWLDPDEKISEDMVKFISDFFPQPNTFCYAFQRQEIILGHTLTHADASTMYRTRLFHKKHGSFVGKVHEIWESSSTPTKRQEKIFHLSHSTISGFIKKVNFYSTLRSQELYKKNKKANLFQIVFFPMGKFFSTYWLHSAYKDGMPGMTYSLMMSFHSFLVRAKLWHLHNSSSQFPV